MNRIILIGNGFDLAHGMKTSYRQFINNYWEKCIKEVFTYKDNKTLLIANIASPNSIGNIKENANVCVSFVDVFIQKGYKLKGTAILINKDDNDFKEKVKPLTDLFTNSLTILPFSKHRYIQKL